MRKYWFLIIISFGLWAAGSILVAKAETEMVVSEEKLVFGVAEAGKSFLSELAIPKNSIRTELVPGGRFDDKWLGSDTRALYWYEDEMIVVYGHNTKDIFGDLKNVKVGSQIVLKDFSGREMKYIVFELKVVEPDDYQVISETQTDLILITCTGRWDEKRLIVKAVGIK